MQKEKEDDAITKEFVWELAKRYSLKEVSLKLKFPITSLKKKCRDLGIRTWPFRIFKSYFMMQKSEMTSAEDKKKLQRIIDTSLYHQFDLPKDMDVIIKKARQKVYNLHRYRH